MDVERRSLYNSLRMNWLHDPSVEVEAWQVEDYRSMPLEALFDKLKQKGFVLDRSSFLALAEKSDTPEDLTDVLVADTAFDAKEQDQIYLIVFELWRKLIPEKPCLSVFCDELDHQIYLYDRGESSNSEALQDALANLKVILDENVDVGIGPGEVLESINAGCANDIESFLYDYISEQIDNRNESYAWDLLDAFFNYVKDTKWFEFLKARLLFGSDPESANQILLQIIKKNASTPELEFNFEILAFLVQGGERPLFVKLVKQTIPLLEVEEDFQDLLAISAEYYRLLDLDHEEQEIQNILKKRLENPPEGVFQPNDPHIAELLQIVT